MDVCQGTVISGSETAVCSSPRTANPVQVGNDDEEKCVSSSGPDSTERVVVTSSPLHAHPLKRGRTQKGKRQGIKRKMDDVKEEEHQGKKSGENESPSTSERSRGTQSDVGSKLKIKQDPSSRQDSSVCDLAATAASCSEQHLLDLPPPLTVKVKTKSCSNQEKNDSR